MDEAVALDRNPTRRLIARRYRYGRCAGPLNISPTEDRCCFAPLQVDQFLGTGPKPRPRVMASGQ
jgi:hypothetical protein